MISGPSSRRRKAQKKYADFQKNLRTKCVICDLTDKSNQVVASTRSFRLIKNIFGYDIWDDTPVKDHLMIVPKRHIVGLHELSKNEVGQYFKLIAEYEKKGYSVYARAPQNIVKSVMHQHTHLIKLGKKRSAFRFYIRKPHVLIFK